MQKQFAWMAESVRRFDETGELWTGDMNGQLVRCEGKYANRAPKDPEAYFDRLRAGLDGYRKGIEHQLQVAASAASWRRPPLRREGEASRRAGPHRA